MIFYHGTLQNLEVGDILSPSFGYLADRPDGKNSQESRVYFTPHLSLAMAFALRALSTDKTRSKIDLLQPGHLNSPVHLSFNQRPPQSIDESMLITSGEFKWTPLKEDEIAYVYGVKPLSASIYNMKNRVQILSEFSQQVGGKYYLKNEGVMITSKQKITMEDFMNLNLANRVKITRIDRLSRTNTIRIDCQEYSKFDDLKKILEMQNVQPEHSR